MRLSEHPSQSPTPHPVRARGRSATPRIQGAIDMLVSRPISALIASQSRQSLRRNRLKRARLRVESLEDRALLSAAPSLTPSAAVLRALDHVATGTTLTLNHLTVADVNQANH